MTPEPQLHIVRTVEEMQEFIWNINSKIVLNEEVPDSDITKCLLYQRDLNQHNLEKKPSTRKGKPAAAPAAKINLEDL